MNALIVILCIITLIIYTFTENYDSFKGVLIFLLASFALLIKIFFIKEVSFKIFVPETLIISGIITLVFSVVGFLLLLALRIKNRKFTRTFLCTLFILYLPFALLQQIFFQYIFLNTLSSFFASKVVILSLGVLFFTLAHLPRETTKLTVFSLIAGCVWMWTYMSYGNILWPILSHAVLAPLYYCFVHPSNRLLARLKFLRTG
jgi:membrane protease YdiL (CAAX protease family)